MRVMIAAGGTGGHVYPGIAVYRALQRSGQAVEALFVGAKSGVEKRIFEELDLPNVLLPGRGVRGTSLASKLVSPFLLLFSVARGVKEILSFRPDVVIGTGGFASVAIVAASVLCRKRSVLQEQNSVPGMANRVLSRFANLVLLSYTESRSFFGSAVRCEVVGNPLRLDVVAGREAGCGFFELRGDLPTVFVFGGSRGAHSINEAVKAAVKNIVSRREVQFVILTGENDYAGLADELRPFEKLVRVMPFLERIEHAYSVADVAVARAGASSVFELAAFGVPTIFVPYPYAADDHQRRNVRELEKFDAAVVIDNHMLDGARLETMIESLLDDEARRAGMSKRMRGWARADAADAAAKLIVDLVERSRLSHTRVTPDGTKTSRSERGPEQVGAGGPRSLSSSRTHVPLPEWANNA